MTDPGDFVLDRSALVPLPPLSPEELYALLERIEDAKKIMACAPDVFERVRDQVYGSGLGAYYRVIENAFLKDGQVVVIDPALLRPPPFELPADFLAPKYRCLNCLDPIYEPGHCWRCEPFAKAMQARTTGLSPLITGLIP